MLVECGPASAAAQWVLPGLLAHHHPPVGGGSPRVPEPSVVVEPSLCDTAVAPPVCYGSQPPGLAPSSNQAAVPLSRRFGASVDSIQGYCSG